ncbi:hypothetical protein BC835DRAFT_103012 [Cytidiella melzeri]|nr:hypothetical protein BC835DRAFT_103012 [Cytidiella melzeri]
MYHQAGLPDHLAQYMLRLWQKPHTRVTLRISRKVAGPKMGICASVKWHLLSLKYGKITHSRSLSFLRISSLTFLTSLPVRFCTPFATENTTLRRRSQSQTSLSPIWQDGFPLPLTDAIALEWHYLWDCSSYRSVITSSTRLCPSHMLQGW